MSLQKKSLSSALNTICLIGSLGNSEYLDAQNFSFSIPAGATIDGITVEVEKSRDSGMDNVQDQEVKIIKGGSIGSENKAAGGNWPDADAYSSYGGAADLWSETWTQSDINASNFGMAISATTDSIMGAEARIDHVRITVEYTAAAGGSDSMTRTAKLHLLRR